MTARRFELHRDDDVSGVSGTGVVAEGVLFSSGRVALEWLSAWLPTTRSARFTQASSRDTNRPPRY